jgi:hypothetical protein
MTVCGAKTTYLAGGFAGNSSGSLRTAKVAFCELI